MVAAAMHRIRILVAVAVEALVRLVLTVSAVVLGALVVLGLRIVSLVLVLHMVAAVVVEGVLTKALVVLVGEVLAPTRQREALAQITLALAAVREPLVETVEMVL
jgi:hypothetical protein